MLERGNFLPRELDNWDPAPVFIDGQLHLRGDVVRRRRQGLPAAGALLRRRRDEVLRRRALPAPTARLRRDQARRRHLARVAARLRRLRAVLHEGRVALPGARQPRRGPDRRPLEQAVPVARRVSTSHASSSCRTIWRSRATTRSTARAGSCSTRRHGAPRARASAAPGATAFRASCTPSPTPRVVCVDPARRHPNVTLLVDAEVTQLETDASGRKVSAVVVTRPTARGTLLGATSSCCRPAPQQRQDPLAVGERPASERARERLRPGRSQLHVPQQQGRVGAVEERNDTRFQKTLGLNDFYFGDD